ncbi:HAD family hydrolase [uncultured Formosa sp.]|uniref:HAD family hydrolase n=1 Tax=uncultured Formosa sp. TaxID=255435 RepID=UPI002617B6AA|nr:HAD family hydrolase [uncultured Formosa sp.]
MILKHKIIVVLDLDDTLYNEIDFLKSAYKEISDIIAKHSEITSESIFNQMMTFYNDKKNTFEEIITSTQVKNITVSDLLTIYRNHSPYIVLSKENKETLTYLKANMFKIGLITDGRSTQQRNKIKALGLEHFFDDIIISEEFGSEKPNTNNFKYFNDKYGEATYLYIGDNVKKDFIAPNTLNWYSVCLLDNGVNIHTQDMNLSKEQSPVFKINVLKDIKNVLCEII